MVCALILVLGGWADGARAGIVTIDDFSLPGSAAFFHLGSGTNPTTTLTQIVNGALGGERDAMINVVGPGKPNSATGLIGHDTDYNINALQVQTDGLSPAIATLQYSGHTTGNTASSLVNAHALSVVGGGVDLTNGGENTQFLLEFVYVDASPSTGLDFTITITNPGGKTSTTKVETALNRTSTFNFYVPFTDLTGDASPNDVDSIKYVFNGANQVHNADYVVQLLGTAPQVPEPASGTLMAVALGVLSVAAHCARRRQSRRSRAES